MKFEAVIVDDEPLARQIIIEYLEEHPSISVVAECGNGREAVKTINELKPDVAFLDIQMPVMNGFEVLENLEHFPKIIFSTAFDQFALKAFEVNAIDYLLKPYSRERLAQAVEKITQSSKSGAELDNLISLLSTTQQKQQEAFADKIFVKMGSKIVPVAIDDILWVEAAGDYATLHTEAKSYLCNTGLGELDKRLDPAKFTRVHRSYIIATSALAHLKSDGEGGYIATIKNGQKVRVSRSYAPKMRNLIL